MSDLTTLVSEDLIVEVLSNLDSESPLDTDAVEYHLDFANSLLYRLQSALEQELGVIANCQCRTELSRTDLFRGNCPNCFGAIVLKISGKVVEPHELRCA